MVGERGPKIRTRMKQAQAAAHCVLSRLRTTGPMIFARIGMMQGAKPSRPRVIRLIE
jgi:hypothetical protein